MRMFKKRHSKFILTCVGLMGAMVGGCPADAFDFNAMCAHLGGGGFRPRVATPSTLNAILSRAEAGAVISLSGGAYGHVTLSRANSGVVTIEGAPGQKSVLSSLKIRGGPWIVRGLKVVGLSSQIQDGAAPLWGAWPSHDSLVKIDNANNVLFDGNIVASADGEFPWREETKGVADPAGPATGVHAGNSTCVTISNNSIYNVFNGISVEGNQVGNNGKYFQILNNKIDNFAGDGIDHSISYATIKGNIIENNHDICKSQCVHSDGIQGWNYNNQMGIVNYDVTIDGNTIIVYTKNIHLMPSSDLQGITIFDGFWRGVNVLNNVVVSNTWHGITLMGVDGAHIINNTIVSVGYKKTTWLNVGGKSHQGSFSKHVLVRNNITPYMYIEKTALPAEDLKLDHNIVGYDPKKLFVEFDPSLGRYDLHLRPGAPVFGLGDPDLAPPRDRDGVARVAPIDLGAYQRAH